MSCTLESSVGCAMGNEVLRFGSIDQVLNDDDLRGFEQGIEWIDQSKRGFEEGVGCALNEATLEGRSARPRQLACSRQKLSH